MATQFEKEFVNRVGRLSRQLDIGESAGRIWGILLVRNKPLTQQEIVKESVYSLSLVSPLLHSLQRFGMVSIAGKQGKKRLYSPTISFIEFFEHAMRELMERDVKPMVELLSSNLADVKEQDIKQRFKRLISEYQGTKESLDLFLKMLAAQKHASEKRLRLSIAKKTP